jgi:His/Glu/Gln/Arg/opine family amino acid ABC transporter permease subunit
MLDVSVIAFGVPILLLGLLNTIIFCSISIALGMVVGCVVALARISRRAALRQLAKWFVEVLRNTPLLIQAFLVFFALPQIGLRFNATTAGVIVLTLFAAANFAEAFRGAILSVPKGHAEAARAVGMPYFMMMRRVIFPQMLGYAIPALANQIIGVIKESAALSVITVPEVSMAAQVVVGESFSPIEAYLMVAVLYWLLTTAVAIGMGLLERRFANRGARGNAGPGSRTMNAPLAASHP